MKEICVHRAAQANSVLKPKLSLSQAPEKGPAESQYSGSVPRILPKVLVC